MVGTSQRVTVRVEGLNALARLCKKAKDSDLPAALKSANKTAADVIASDAKALAPVGKYGDPHPGLLASTVRAVSTQRSGSIRVGGSKTPYASAIHWGWNRPDSLGRRHGISPQPFLVRALEKNTERVSVTYADAINSVVEAFKG